ncbi:hypothetical protein [Nodosilinea nodulosa]|uniref:hypothetical protein n=1 Tax=Nodosilinea nodulosa TaxID=416001 RepID=UPI0002E3C25A|nr:hypothetical protein [Nodosilinea nodulosa]
MKLTHLLALPLLLGVSFISFACGADNDTETEQVNPAQPGQMEGDQMEQPGQMNDNQTEEPGQMNDNQMEQPGQTGTDN